jgi:hypothetical protein
VGMIKEGIRNKGERRRRKSLGSWRCGVNKLHEGKMVVDGSKKGLRGYFVFYGATKGQWFMVSQLASLSCLHVIVFCISIISSVKSKQAYNSILA